MESSQTSLIGEPTRYIFYTQIEFAEPGVFKLTNLQGRFLVANELSEGDHIKLTIEKINAQSISPPLQQDSEASPSRRLQER